MPKQQDHGVGEDKRQVKSIIVKTDTETQRAVLTTILDATTKHTGLPTDEEKLDHYLRFVQQHLAKEKLEYIRAYHLDQSPNVAYWEKTFH